MEKWKERMNGYNKTKRLILLSLLALIVSGCVSHYFKSEREDSEEYLEIAVVGEVPAINKAQIHLTAVVSIEEARDNAELFDAIMITPDVFDIASEDEYIEVYKNSGVPIIFFDSEKRHFPFVTEDMSYETAEWEAFDNKSHTTMFLYDAEKNIEDVWYFYLKDVSEHDQLFTDIARTISSL